MTAQYIKTAHPVEMIGYSFSSVVCSAHLTTLDRIIANAFCLCLSVRLSGTIVSHG